MRDGLQDWECGTRLVFRSRSRDVHVVALSDTGRHGWMIMRESGDVRTVPAAVLRKWSAADGAWEGPDEPLPIPEALRLVIGYYEFKARLLAGAVPIENPRQTAGMLIVVYGMPGAIEACTQLPYADREAVRRELEAAGLGAKQ